ncbi:MAG: hypothetical protein ACYSUF_12695 [Planctomycetota bacterium]|jgi:hypothetical protein
MKKFFAAGLVLVAVSTAAARPLSTDPADTDRPVEADRAAPARRPLEPGQIAVGRPLEPGWVAADAMWLIHLDLGAFKNSTIGRFVLEHPETDFMSFTLYGFSDDPEADGVVVAVTTARADEALARLKAIEEINSVEVNLEGYPVQVLSGQGERHYLHVRAADRRDQRIVVLAGSEDVLLRAIKVIDNRAPSLSAARSSILDGGPDRGSIVFVACLWRGDCLGHQPRERGQHRRGRAGHDRPRPAHCRRRAGGSPVGGSRQSHQRRGARPEDHHSHQLRCGAAHVDPRGPR